MRRFALSVCTYALLSAGALAAEHVEITVMNYNVRGLVWPENSDRTRFTTIGRTLKRRLDEDGPDFVLFQEVFEGYSHPVYQEAQYPFGLDGGSDGLLYGSGLYTLSKYPILESFQQKFRRCYLEECLVSKQFHGIVVRLPGISRPVLIMNSHLQHGSEDRRRENVRLSQADDIRDYLANRHLMDDVIIFAGDFNFKPKQNSYWYFLSRMSFVDSGRFCLDHPSCRIELAPGLNDTDVWKSSADRQFFHAPSGSNIVVEPIHLTRPFTEIGANGKPLSDHWAYEVRYRITETY